MPLFNDIVYSAGVPVIPGVQYWDKILWVNSNGGSDANDGTDRRKPLSTIFGTAGAWAKAADTTGTSPTSPNAGTLVIVMKGHTESVSSADAGSALGSKTRVYTIGQGEGPERPTLTWTVAAATLLLDQVATVLDNFNLNLEPGTGSVNVAAPISLTAAGCGLRRITARAGTDANNKVTVGITVSAADCFIDNPSPTGRNLIYSATAAEATTFLRLTAADRFRLENTSIVGATTAVGVGVVQFLTTASTHVYFNRFFIANQKAASTAAVSGIASNIGFATNGLLHVLANTASELTSAWGTKAAVQFGPDVSVTNDFGENGATLLPVSA